MAITMAWTFMFAYFGGTYSTTITINNYGEAHIELVIILAWILLSIIKFIHYRCMSTLDSVTTVKEK